MHWCSSETSPHCHVLASLARSALLANAGSNLQIRVGGESAKAITRNLQGRSGYVFKHKEYINNFNNKMNSKVRTKARSKALNPRRKTTT
jgi:hypothetical protein